MTPTARKQIIKKLSASLGRPGLSTKRACDLGDIKLCIAKTKEAKRRVRIYSSAGFVPNSYGYRCEIQYVEATKVADDFYANYENEPVADGWHFCIGWSGAGRSNGRGPLVVVQ